MLCQLVLRILRSKKLINFIILIIDRSKPFAAAVCSLILKYQSLGLKKILN